MIDLDDINTKIAKLEKEIKDGDALTTDYVLLVLAPIVEKLLTEIKILLVREYELVKAHNQDQKRVQRLEETILLLKRSQSK
ncbi:MAG: hypothetical protein WC483_02865 [Candidatus Paceibacterota bacterium]|jgi:hypothetical protein|nr:hypothetical protein [Candidatus Paceibacterota bacterium]